MRLWIIVILLSCGEDVTKAIIQDIPSSPCPKIFQYRFDGSEWFGVVAVRNLDRNQVFQLRVSLSMHGKPRTQYLGEIKLLTRGEFVNHKPLIYEVRFPKNEYPPKLINILFNNRIICFGSGGQGMFLTQIQLEHTRKIGYAIGEKQPKQIIPSVIGVSGKAVKKNPSSVKWSANEFDLKHLPQVPSRKKPFYSPMEICGKINENINLPYSLSKLQDAANTQWERQLSMANKGNANESNISQFPVFAALGDIGSSEEVENLLEDHNETEIMSFPDTSTSAVLPSITRGVWPWLAAIYVNNISSLNYQCSGTVISTRGVISSAHCFQRLNQHYTPNEVLVLLGKYNLNNWNEEDSLAVPVDAIYIHPDYNNQLTTYDSDIAIIILKDKVRFNTFIQPVCLWYGSSDANFIIGEHGVVIGWSFSEMNENIYSTLSPLNATIGSIPKLVNALIISNKACFKANTQFEGLSSNRTFCGKILGNSKLKKKVPSRETQIINFYTGLSGAGLMLLKNNHWMLRGTVSAALPPSPFNKTESLAVSNGNNYLIYTDVAKFIDWIVAFII